MRFRKFLNPYKTRDSSFREYTGFLTGGKHGSCQRDDFILHLVLKPDNIWL